MEFIASLPDDLASLLKIVERGSGGDEQF
jgi:hypothetical protein